MDIDSLTDDDLDQLASQLAGRLPTGRYGGQFVLSRRQLLSLAGGSAGVAGLTALGVDPATAQSAAGQVGTQSSPEDVFAFDLDVQGALQRDLDAGGHAIENAGSVSTEDLAIFGSNFGVTDATLTAIIDSDHGSERNQQITEDVSTTAVEIFNGRAGDLDPKGLFVAVYGEDGSANRFTELLLNAGGGGVVVVASADRGSPTGRSYTESGNAISLAMASDTYDVVAEGVGLGVGRG